MVLINSIPYEIDCVYVNFEVVHTCCTVYGISPIPVVFVNLTSFIKTIRRH